jgi:bifunctional non-homologous end joining protein LigD
MPHTITRVTLLLLAAALPAAAKKSSTVDRVVAKLNEDIITVSDLAENALGTGRGALAQTPDTFRALLVGRPQPEGLALAGGVGTGFDQRTLRGLTDRLRGLVVAECPFDPTPPVSVARTATWVEPLLRARVEIAEFTNDGLVRHATFIGLAD